MNATTRTVLVALMLACWGCSPDRGGLNLDQDGGGAAGAGGMPGSGGRGGVPAAGGAGGIAGAAGGAGGRDAGSPCDGGCGSGRACCEGRCVNLENDPTNCGACGKRCEPARPVCAKKACDKAPCSGGTTCAGTAFCCAKSCCPIGELCCIVAGPAADNVICHKPTVAEPTCPQGCAPLCVSDRNVKESIAPVDPRGVLAKLADMPIATWRYRNESQDVRHMGPMAQDFRAAFGLGDSDTSYHAVDAQGVALAAIQALERLAAEQSERLERLEQENRALKSRLRGFEQRLGARDRVRRSRR